MGDFYRSMRLDAAQQLEQLSRLAFELRESRKQLLQRYAVDSEDALLELIRAGAVAEHPGYDHYLGACVLERAWDAVRSQLRAVLADL